MATHDVFVSYNWRDHEAAQVVATALQQQGLKVFLDRWYLVPGRPWPQALEAAIGSARAVAVLFGPFGLGSWQQRETVLALDRQGHDASFPVVPVLASQALV